MGDLRGCGLEHDDELPCLNTRVRKFPRLYMPVVHRQQLSKCETKPESLLQFAIN